jgi:hypothetical protein
MCVRDKENSSGWFEDDPHIQEAREYPPKESQQAPCMYVVGAKRETTHRASQYSNGGINDDEYGRVAQSTFIGA